MPRLENVRSTSVLSKIHKMFLRFLFSQSQFDHLRYNSLTLALSQKTARKSTRSYSFIAHSLATQEFPVIVDFIYWFSFIHVKMPTSYLSRNMITTRFRHGQNYTDYIIVLFLTLLLCIEVVIEPVSKWFWGGSSFSTLGGLCRKR